MSYFAKYQHLDDETKHLIGLGLLQNLILNTNIATRADFWDLLSEAGKTVVPARLDENAEKLQFFRLSGDEMLKRHDMFVALLSSNST